MRKLTPFLLLGSILLAMTSCQKEKSVDTLSHGSGSAGSTGSEKGTWKFLFMQAATSQTIEYKDGIDDVKTVTISDYTTENNAGTVKFDGSKMTATGLTYSVDAMAKGYLYTNGVLEDSLEFPFAATVPPTSSTASYKKAGADSIYVQSGVFTGIGSGGTTQATPGGYKLKFNGDKMTMTTVYDDTKLEFVMGMSQKTISHAVVVLTLQKQ
ncbi:hypothetical protein FAM09_24950 [Niastella caeni]|uniref:Uncharacterized protein n=1 Tax=Niastella caeni TaxID=2569763 RepID=A0A4S8HGJ0_9BACT|nr:hypothetical protein [Niastella caeni]THU34270.1 hypothetical protein FAM09_24950 [Niastella caeni]